MPEIPELKLLTSHHCHLCEHSKHVLDELLTEGVLEWTEIREDTEAGRALAAVSPPMRPVLFSSDGRPIAYGRLSQRRLRKQLQKLAKAA